MPPMEAPTTWALSTPNAPSSAAPSSAMSSIRYTADERSVPVNRAAISGSPSNLVDSPLSRLS